MAPKLLMICSDTDEEWNCSEWRVMVPYKALLKKGYPVEVVNVDVWNLQGSEAERLTREADLVFFQRNVFGNATAPLQRWLARGKQFVIDLDDAYHHMTRDTGTPTYDTWHNGIFKKGDKQYLFKPKPLESLEWAVQLAGAVSTPSQLLCDDWSSRARTYLLPNYIDPSNYRRRPVYKNPGQILIGWGGSASHLRSWRDSNIVPALQSVITERKGVDLLLVGDPAVEKTFAIRPSSRKISLGWTHLFLWPERLSMFDIGLAPLAGEYDRRRSPVKPMEYSIIGIPWVGSDLEPNRGVGAGVLVNNTADDWYKALSELLDGLSAYKRMALERVEEYSRLYSMDSNVEQWIETLERIWQEGDHGA